MSQHKVCGRSGVVRRESRWKFLLIALLAVMAGNLGFRSAYAAPAPANTPIGNQAAATYLDSSGTQQTARSNTVTTIVQQVAAVDLTQDQSKIGSVNGPVAFPHTVVNNGNGNDVFNLTAIDLGGDNYNIAPVIYADADGNGVPDNGTPITVTPTLAAGESFSFVVVGAVPSSALAGQTAQIRVTATSQFDGTVSDVNTDTVTATTNAAVSIIKSISASSGASPSGPYTYTLTFTNSGNTAATGLTITDTIPTGMTYVPGSGLWSGSGSPLTDAAGGDPAGVTYTSNPPANDIITAVIASIAPGASGTLKFNVNVNPNLSPRTIPNAASFHYDDDANAATADKTGTTNTVNFTVVQVGGVTFTGETVTSAPQGTTVTFHNTLTNTGTGTDTFDIVVNPAGTTNFPAGTAFLLFKSDGATPLTDTNGNGIPDTGPVAAAAPPVTPGTYVVVLKAVLPTGATSSVPPVAFTVDKKATSKFDPTKTATATDQLDVITPNTVDVTNDSIGGPGVGSGTTVAGPPITTKTANPGTTVRFTLFVTNTSTVSDSYDLAANPLFNFTGTFPAGVTVTFRNTANAVITNTGTLAAGASKQVFADVLLPPLVPPGNIEVFFRAKSPTSGATDIKHDQVTVNTLRSLSVKPDNSGQIFPGGSIVYTHTVTNTGNVTEGPINLTVVDGTAGFTSSIYADTNNSGTLDAGDAVISSIATLAPGASTTIFVKVFAPPGAADATVDVATLTGTATGGPGAPPTDSATDTTTVRTTNVRVDKKQALDANNDGTPDTAYSAATITTGALPGRCIRYQITVTNAGSTPATNLVVNDTTPAFTVYDNGNGTDSATGNAVWTPDGTTFTPASTVPADGAAGTLVFTIGTLNPGQTVTITFGVKIQQ